VIYQLFDSIVANKDINQKHENCATDLCTDFVTDWRNTNI